LILLMFLSSPYDDLPMLFTVILGLSLGCSPTIRLRSPHVRREYVMNKSICAIALLFAVPAMAEGPYPTPTRDGKDRIQRTGTCPTDYVAKGNLCEALDSETPRAMPKINGKACPSGYFASGDACKAFR
jgi:hypothetical protein